jgi:hypothetical protein
MPGLKLTVPQASRLFQLEMVRYQAPEASPRGAAAMLFPVRHPMLEKRSRSGRDAALQTPSKKIHQVSNRHDSHRSRSVGDHQTPNRPPAHDVGGPSNGGCRRNANNVSGHQVAHRSVPPHRRASGSAGVAIGQNADSPRPFGHDQMMNALRAHQIPSIVCRRVRRNRLYASCHHILYAHDCVSSSRLADSCRANDERKSTERTTTARSAAWRFISMLRVCVRGRIRDAAESSWHELE